jgi:hypothetical protein
MYIHMTHNITDSLVELILNVPALVTVARQTFFLSNRSFMLAFSIYKIQKMYK